MNEQSVHYRRWILSMQAVASSVFGVRRDTRLREDNLSLKGDTQKYCKIHTENSDKAIDLYTVLPDRQSHEVECQSLYISEMTLKNCSWKSRGSHYVLPRLRTKFAERGFSYAGSAAWNRLPESIRRTSSQAAFKRQLKTFLFCDAFITLLYQHLWTSI